MSAFGVFFQHLLSLIAERRCKKRALEVTPLDRRVHRLFSCWKSNECITTFSSSLLPVRVLLLYVPHLLNLMCWPYESHSILQSCVTGMPTSDDLPFYFSSTNTHASGRCKLTPTVRKSVCARGTKNKLFGTADVQTTKFRTRFSRHIRYVFVESIHDATSI